MMRHLSGSVPCLVLVVTAVLTVAGAAAAQDHKTPPPHSPEQYFQFACAACHGAEGKGGGPVAARLTTPPPDLTKISQRHGGAFPTRQIYEQIEGLAMPTAHGTREMPVWGAVVLFEELGTSVRKEDASKAARATRQRLEELVGYLESIQE